MLLACASPKQESPAPGSARNEARPPADSGERWVYRWYSIKKFAATTTYTLDVSGERATLTMTGEMGRADGTHWQPSTASPEVFIGTLRNESGALQLDVSDTAGKHWILQCIKRTQHVAVSTAIRIPDPGVAASCDSDAVWSPATTVPLEILDCGPSRSPERWTFAQLPGVEHVKITGECGLGGEALRAMPDDGSHAQVRLQAARD
jgi:hypothetical protein